MARRCVRLGLVIFVLACAMSRAAGAQVIERPPRSTEGLFGGGLETVNPNVTRSELTLSLDATGGWDDNLVPEGTGVSTNPFGQQQSGYAGVGSAALRFWRGRTTRSFESRGRAFINSYSDLGVGTVAGGEFTVQGQAQLWRRDQITFVAEMRYQPTLILGAFGPVADQVDSGVVPDTDPSRGVSSLRSISGIGSVDYTREWTRRQRTAVRYDYARRRFLDGNPFNSNQHNESVRHSWDFSRPVGLDLWYRHSDQQMEQAIGGTRGLATDSAEVGFEFRKSLSRTRHITTTGGAGATHVKTSNAVDGMPFDYTAPSGYASTRMDLGRTWAVSADYRRTVNVLEGLTSESFFTDSASVSLGGNLGSRLGVVISSAFSRGTAQGTDTGRYESTTGTAQVQYELSNWWSLMASYSYYEHRLQDLSAIIPGFPFRFERNSIRAGMSMRLPLYGSFPGGESARRRRR